MSTPIQSARVKLLMSLLWLTSPLIGCTHSETEVWVTGDVSSKDLAEIKRSVSNEIVKRSGARASIRSVVCTTNNRYAMAKQTQSLLGALATSNRNAEFHLRQAEKVIDSGSSGITNCAVDVWYSDAKARWGEAGFRLEKGSNGWEIISELSR